MTDPGLASERTELAWSRSALAMLACGAATVKGVPHVTNGHPVTGATLLALGGLVWLSGLPLAHRRKGRHGRARRAATFHDLAPVAFGSALVGAAAFVIAALFPN